MQKEPYALTAAVTERISPAGKSILWDLMTLADSASSKLSSELQSRHPEVEWTAIKGFRNLAAHGYLELRLERVRQIIDRDLHLLKRVVENELVNLKNSGG
ncbi:MAG: HepT-like ribonuclease domain-containing protein [Candidatus Dormibacteraceae bacterium]